MLRRGCSFGLLCLTLLALAGRPPAIRAGLEDAEEYMLKAAYIRHFGGFITWPGEFAPGGADTFVIAVVGRDPFGDATLGKLRTLKVGERKIVVHRWDTVRDVKPCHILFLAPEPAEPEKGLTPEQRLAGVQKQLNGSPTLLVTDQEGLARRGAMINFYLEQNRVKFEINKEAARQMGLTISSNLLKIAKIVTTE